METKELIDSEMVLSYQNYFFEQMNLSKDDWRLAEKIEEYSYFKASQIQMIIEKLVNLFEGEKYSCIEVDHDTYKYKSGIWGTYIAEVMDRVLLVTKGDIPKNESIKYSDICIEQNTIDEMIEEGNTFVIKRVEFTTAVNSVDFYKIKGGRLFSTVDFQRFTYVKDFMDFVIGYRLKNNTKSDDISKERLIGYRLKEDFKCDDISKELLLDLLSTFVNANRQTIDDNYDKKIQLYLRKEEVKKCR